MQPDDNLVRCACSAPVHYLSILSVTETCTTHPNPMLGQQLQQDFQELLTR
jgi:hypothetical protein